MRSLSTSGRRVVNDLAKRHGFSEDAAASMLNALIDGRGTMAQFDHGEFGGHGQWMQSGMTMVSGWHDRDLARRVDALCADLAEALAREPLVHESETVARARDIWWPQALGEPASTGAQDDVRYAYFPDRRRLAVEAGSELKVYDTLDYRIHGFAQQQGSASALRFTSQRGAVDVASLPEANADKFD